MSLQRFLAKFGRTNTAKPEECSFMKEDFTARFMQKISMPIVRIIYPFSIITPNRLTWLSYFVVILGSIILIVSEGNIILLFLVGLCVWFSALIDGLDGQLARMRGVSSKKGQWLDRVLDEGKGYPFFFALGLYIQDSSGYFTLSLFGTQLIELNVWITMTILFACASWLGMMSTFSNWILKEPGIVSNGNVYIVWIILIFNLLDWFLFLFTIGTFLAVVWTLFEKTFFTPANPPESTETIENE